jgi:hypothetical protein
MLTPKHLYPRAYEEILADVLAVVRRQVPSDAVLPASRLLQDLGIDGDDAAEVLDECVDTLGFDMSGLEWSKYFHSEPVDWVALLGRGGDKAELTVEHLARCAHGGRWFEPK